MTTFLDTQIEFMAEGSKPHFLYGLIVGIYLVQRYPKQAALIYESLRESPLNESKAVEETLAASGLVPETGDDPKPKTTLDTSLTI